MRRDLTLPGGTAARRARTRAARLVHGLVIATFLAAAACLLLSGVIRAVGNVEQSAALATLGYGLALIGIAVGVLGLALDPSTESDTGKDTP